MVHSQWARTQVVTLVPGPVALWACSERGRRANMYWCATPVAPVLRNPEMTKIVVGVDGSAGSAEALKWAVDEARLRGAELHVAIGWNPYAYIEIPDGVDTTGWNFPEAEAKATLERMITDAVTDPDERDAVVQIAVEGHPTPLLRKLSEDADLLVVGARGHGGFLGLLLGSTSDQIVKHAKCTVVVVSEPHG